MPPAEVCLTDLAWDYPGVSVQVNAFIHSRCRGGWVWVGGWEGGALTVGHFMQVGGCMCGGVEACKLPPLSSLLPFSPPLPLFFACASVCAGVGLWARV